MAESLPAAIFDDLGGGRFRGTELSAGPWDPEAMHGGPPGALLAGELEATVHAADLGEFVPVRVTVELLRPVPVGADLRVETTARRPGRKVFVADGTLTHDGTAVAAATLQCIRRRPFDTDVVDSAEPPPLPPATADRPVAAGPLLFHLHGVEHRFVTGSFSAAGPAIDWIRLRVPLVAGRDTTPLERIVAAADFGNGISGVVPFGELLYINPDLTVFLQRVPVDEWVCLDAATTIGPDGVGIARSELFDRRGHLGHSTQTLLIEPR